MTKTLLAVATSAALLFSVGSAFAQQGTTLAGPAQGSKANGEASTRPSGEGAGSNGAASTGGAGTGAGVATGTMSGGSTATGGNVGGPAGRN